jgi:hypothetical protein
VSAPCYAAGGDGAAAEVLFREGRKDLEANKYQEACQKFAESERLDPAAGTLMNLATCEEKLGMLASAWQHWREAIDALSAGDERVPFARARVNDLEKRLPRLTVVLPADTNPRARIFRDEVELGKASQKTPLPVDPGPHTITVQVPGRKTASKAFSIGEAEQKVLEARPGPIDADAAMEQEQNTPSQTMGWVLGGVGLAGLGTAAATGVMLAGHKSTLEAQCPHKVCSTQAGLDAAASGRTLLVVNSAAWIVGGLALGVGAYFILAGPSRASDARVVPSVGPHGAQVSYQGCF